MPSTLRHFLSILVLPFVVVVVIPFVLLYALVAFDTRWGSGPGTWLPQGLGLLVFSLGLALTAWCVRLFAQVGDGTLAPWDPAQKLVTAGPYQLVRNPMISGVAIMLLGEALYFGSWIIEVWAIAFVAINHVYFVFYEEPELEKRFGDAYRRYKANVPRWIARLTPWKGGR